MERNVGTVSRGIRGPIIREGDNISFKDIDKMLLTEKSANAYIDPDYEPFGKPGTMVEKINYFLNETNQPLPATKGQTALCILESLAMTYRYYIEYRVFFAWQLSGGARVVPPAP